MDGTAQLAVIGPEQLALMQRRVSIYIVGRDADLRPHLVRAMGWRLSADLRELTVFVSAPASRAVLEHLHTNGAIAMVLSEPSSNRTLQLKGGDARIVATEPDDAALVQTYVERFADEIAGLGFMREVVATVFRHQPEDLVAVRFTPQVAFEQTPGPRAGEALGASPA